MNGSTTGLTSTDASTESRADGAARQRRTDEVFDALPRLDEAERESALAEVIELHMPVAERVARRFSRRGIPEEDLRQVAYLALTKAARRYDVTRAGASFLSYAVPTMRGEVRKHFRDRGWMVRPTRRIQEVQARVTRTRDELTAQFSRVPTTKEVADHIDAPLSDVVEAMGAEGCFTPTSLDTPVGADPSAGTATLGDTLGTEDDEMLAAEARAEIGPLLRELPERDRLVIGLRFYEGLTQREIAERIGVTQMQVSRLLSRILARMRHQLGLPDD